LDYEWPTLLSGYWLVYAFVLYHAPVAGPATRILFLCMTCKLRNVCWGGQKWVLKLPYIGAFYHGAIGDIKMYIKHQKKLQCKNGERYMLKYLIVISLDTVDFMFTVFYFNSLNHSLICGVPLCTLTYKRSNFHCNKYTMKL
jgi:hypothetical protein